MVQDTKSLVKITYSKLIISVSIFLVLFDNFSFFENVINVFPLTLKNLPFLGSLAILLTTLIILLFAISCSKFTAKPILISILLVSSIASYFMNNYNIFIDDSMIQNAFETDMREALDLFSVKLVLYFLLAGVLPSMIVCLVKVEYRSFKKEILLRLKMIFSTLFIIILMLFSFSKYYTSFLREHKPLRYYTNPTYFIYSFGEYIGANFSETETVFKQIGTDAKIPIDDFDRELIILVIGEAARADRFSLNGYERETNPLLKNEDIINFTNMYSCGTSTSLSVPCMFSIFKRTDYSDKKAKGTENILDVLTHAGVNILWRDNNSDSKGVALRVTYEDYKTPENNSICDIECRDEGMIEGLQEYIERQKEEDILIVLHQMGNHGPAYYKRYPKSFEKFKPTCKTNQLEECTDEEINNAYDNAILYTDYFLSKVILFLKNYTKQFETGMIYLSDHGESLGEDNLYLHGLPYLLAPDEQKHIAALMWLGEGFEADKDKIKRDAAKPYSQDNLFHTLLGLFEVNTSIYDRNMDIINTYE